MKRYSAIIGCIILAATLVQAQSSNVRIGAHLGLTMGGNLEASGDYGGGDVDMEDGLAFGAQFQHRANEAMSFELSATRFSTEVEDVSGTDLDITTIAATIRFGGSPSQDVYLYGGGGGSYNIFDMDNADFDDEFGYHLCGGVELPMTEVAQFFADYRYTFITFDSDVSGIEVDYTFGMLRVGVNFSL